MKTPSFLASGARAASVVLVLMAALFFITSVSAHAAPASGWIWGGTDSGEDPWGDNDAYQGAGWFSVNASNPTDTTWDGRFSLQIPSTDGDLSGYAWSEHYGWLSFDTAGCAGYGAARRVGNTIVGSAEILASRGVGGFDGCVVFNHGRNDEVTIDPATGELDGYAWSSDLGWLDFCLNPGTDRCVTIPPVGSPAVTLTDNTCTIPSGGTQCSPVLPYTTNTDVVSGEIKNGSGTTVLALGPNQNSSYTVVPALVGEQSVTYTITGRNAAGTEVSDTALARSICTAGESWISGRCQVPATPGGWIYPKTAPTGVSSSLCEIPTGSNTCTHYLDWEVTSAVTLGKLYNVDTNTLIAQGTPVQGQPGSPQRETVTLEHGNHRYELCDEVAAPNCNNIGVQVTVQARCEDQALGAVPEAGTGICRMPTSPEGDITATPEPCVIPLGGSSCTTDIYWYSSAFTDIPHVYVDEGAGENLFDSGTALSDDNTLGYTFPNGESTATFTLYQGTNTGVPEVTKTFQSTCGANVWDAGEGTCVDPNGLRSISLTCDTAPCECTVADGASTCSSGIQFTTTVDGSYTDARTFDQNTGNSVPGSAGPGTSPWSFTFNPVIGATNGPVEYIASANGSDPITGLPTTVSSNPPVPVLVRCASGLEPVGGVCPSTAVDGDLTLSASSCTIADGDGACTVDLSWTTTNVGANDVQITKTPTSWSLDAQPANGSHSNKPMAPENVGDPSTTYTFHLREQSTGTSLDTKTFTASCESGSEWDGDSCEPPATDELTVTPNTPTGVDCPILQGDSECTAQVEWTLSGASPEVQIDGAVEWTGANGDETKAFGRGTYDIEAWADGAVVESELNYEVDCDANLFWDPFPGTETCVAAPSGWITFSEVADLATDNDCLIQEDDSSCTTDIEFFTERASEPFLYRVDAPDILVQPGGDDFAGDTPRNTIKQTTVVGYDIPYGLRSFKIVDEAGAGQTIELTNSNDADTTLVTVNARCADGLSPDYSAAPIIYCRDFSGPQ